jgi:hypothetical protein
MTEMLKVSCRDMIVVHGNKDLKRLSNIIRSLTGVLKLFHISLEKDKMFKVNKAEEEPSCTATECLPPPTPDLKLLSTKRGTQQTGNEHISNLLNTPPP